MKPVLSRVVQGAAAGAAGTTALNAVTYFDMALRGRPESDTPATTVERLSESANVSIPGDPKQRRNRVDGLGPLLGVLAGVTDPRTWSRADWLADLIPHAAYGVVTGAVLDRLDMAAADG